MSEMAGQVCTKVVPFLLAIVFSVTKCEDVILDYSPRLVKNQASNKQTLRGSLDLQKSHQNNEGDSTNYLSWVNGYGSNMGTNDCQLKCKYGLEADIEGRPICRCKDPCKSVKCFGGTKCQPQKKCYGLECFYTAVCKVDDACTLPRPKHTFMCEKLSKRYYFDVKRGRCRKFWGCEDIIGNSFGTKKECRRTCPSLSAKDAEKVKKRRKQRKNRRNRLSKKTEVNHLDNTEAVQTNDVAKVIESMNNNKDLTYKTGKQSTEINEITGCPIDSPFERCPYDPCARCNSPDIVCFTSYCGKCQAVYVDLRTGHSSESYSQYC